MILLTRPYDDSLALQAQLAEHNIESVIAPMLRIEPMDVTFELDTEGVILTSRHAIHALADKTKPLYVVGEQTAQVLYTKYFKSISASAPTAKALIELLCKLPPQRFVYLRGKHISSDLSAALPMHTIIEKIAYEAVATPELSDEVKDALQSGTLMHAALFSARTAQLCEKALRSFGAPLLGALCMSDQIAGALTPENWAGVEVAKAPDMAGMLQLIHTHSRLK